MSIPSRIPYDFSCMRAAAVCLGDFLDRCAKGVCPSALFNPKQVVPSERTISNCSHVCDPRIASIACALAISSPKIASARSPSDDVTELSILIDAPLRARSKSVQFNLPSSDTEKVEKAKSFIFAPSVSFKMLVKISSRLDTAYRAFRKDQHNRLNLDQEIMASLIYCWFRSTCGKNVFHYIPEIDSKTTTAAITYERVKNFGSLFNDERANYRHPSQHILDLQKWILYTPYFDGVKNLPSIEEQYYFRRTLNQCENEVLFKKLIYHWISAQYQDDLYLDIPKLRNHIYIQSVTFWDCKNFAEIFLAEMNRFRTEKGFDADKAH